MNRRIIKQIIYGAFYLIVIFAISYSIYFLFYKSAPSCFDNRQNQTETGVDCGGPCAACEIKTLSSLEANWIKTFPLSGKTAVVAEIKNSNINYAASKFSYNIEAYDEAGNNIKNISQNSFIYAGEVKYIFEIFSNDQKEISDVEISYLDFDWIKKENFQKPKIKIRQISTRLNDSGSAEIDAVVVNEESYPLSKLKLIGFLVNRGGIKISSSKTELENLEAFGESPFKIIFPKGISLTESATSSLFNLNSADPNKSEIYIEAIR